LRGLEHGLAQSAARVVRTRRGLILRRVDSLQGLHRLERLLGRRREQPRGRARVQLLEGARESIAGRWLWRPQAKRLQVVDRERRSGARKAARKLGSERGPAERRGLVLARR